MLCTVSRPSACSVDIASLSSHNAVSGIEIRGESRRESSTARRHGRRSTWRSARQCTPLAAYLDQVLDRYHVGGIRFRGADARTVQAHIRYAQSRSKIPLLVASNPEMGGFGSVDDGTLVTTHLGAGSHPDPSIAREMGRVAGVETTALGCNWAFAPIVDIHRNWRNTVVATRSFGNTPEVVVERAKAYFDGLSESKTVFAIKYFPGDGVDERD